MKLLLTGALGSLGSEILRFALLDARLEKCVVILRGGVHESAADRWQKLQNYWQRFAPRVPTPEQLAKLVMVEGDLQNLHQLKLPPVDVVVHAAASTDFHLSLSAARQANLSPTLALLRWARQLSVKPRMVFVSTAFVCGKERGKINEADVPKHFYNTYERSKWEAEEAVRCSALKYCILRPSVVVGDSVTGYHWRFKVLYSIARAWLSGVMVWGVPVPVRAKVDFVPTDYVCRSVMAVLSGEADGKTLHVCSGTQQMPSLALLDVMVEVFARERPRVLPLALVQWLFKTPLVRTIPHQIRQLMEIMRWHLPYLGRRNVEFDMAAAEKILGLSPAPQQYIHQIFRFAKDSAWGKRRAPLTLDTLNFLDTERPTNT